MNGCRYCVIIHNRKRRGRKRARGIAMCLAQGEMTRCDKKRHDRGPGCEYHDTKEASTASPLQMDKVARNGNTHDTHLPLHIS